jgi:ribosomal protein L40E
VGCLAQNISQRYFVIMNQPGCSQCGAELPPEARFCRQCGTPVPVSKDIDLSELPTAVLNEKINTSTQRLEPRPTSPERRPFTIAEKATTIDTSKPRRRWVPATVLFGLVFLVIIGIVSSVAYVRIRNHNSTAIDPLIYPGAKTIVDLNSSGIRALQLQTGDSLDRVVAWYDTTIKPTKTIRLTPNNVVLKNQNVTVTVAFDAGKTNILIKQVL